MFYFQFNPILPIVVALAAVGANAQPSRFDGPWKATLTCPPHNEDDDDAKGYAHQFAGEVVNGNLTLAHGKHGEPGWHELKGKVQPSGDADLRLNGVVNNPKYAIKDAPKGKPYSYRVKAHFDESKGSGQRLSGRACDFQFMR